MSGRTAMVEYWVLDGWNVAKWRYVPSNPADDGEEWFTVHPEGAEFDSDGARCSSLNEALLVVVTKNYIGSGIEDNQEAWALAFAFARQIGMHRWDGEEWVHVHPVER